MTTKPLAPICPNQYTREQIPEYSPINTRASDTPEPLHARQLPMYARVR